MELNKKRQKIAKAFKVAIEGIVYTFKFHRIMKLHYLIAIAMIIGSIVFKLSQVEKLLLIFAVCLVVVSEMVNTAIEKAIDMTTDESNELAKVVKDVASGGVFIATLNALVATCVIFYDRLKTLSYTIGVPQLFDILIFISIIILILGVVNAIVTSKNKQNN